VNFDRALGGKKRREMLAKLEARMVAIARGQAERTCVYCGCTDSRACQEGCCWAIEHPKTATGVCSRCIEEEFRSLARIMKIILNPV